MFETFKARAEAVSAEVHRFAEASDGLAFIMKTLQDEGVADTPESYAVWADSSMLAGLDKAALAAQVPGLTFDVTREKARDAKIGISQMQWGLANTGSVVQNSTDPKQRLVASLTNIHIAVMPTDAILPDLPALLSAVHPDDCGYLSVISGPSRTADIERVLTIGVHGPERLIVVCIDALGGHN